MTKKTDFNIGDKVKFKTDVKLYPTAFSRTPIYFAKKGDKGVVVKPDPKKTKMHKEATRVVAVAVDKQKHPVYLVDSATIGLLYVDSTIERV